MKLTIPLLLGAGATIAVLVFLLRRSGAGAYTQQAQAQTALSRMFAVAGGAGAQISPQAASLLAAAKGMRASGQEATARNLEAQAYALQKAMA